MTVGIDGLALPHVAWREWERRDHWLPYVYVWWDLGCTEDVINPHRHRVDRIEGRWGNDKEVDEGRQVVGRTQRVKKAEVKVIGPNRWTNSCLMAKRPSLSRVGTSAAGIEIPLWTL